MRRAIVRSVFPARSERARLRNLTHPIRWRMRLLAALSFGSGALEAAFLVVVTRVGLAVADGKSSTGVLNGVRLSIGGALVLGAVILAVRLALSMISISVSTRLVADVGRSMKDDLARSYLAASWSVMQREPSGRLLQLIGGTATAAVSVVVAMTNVVVSSVNLAALLLFAFVVDPVSMVAVVIALIGLSAALAPIRARVRSRSRRANEIAMDVASSVSELGGLGLEMQVYGTRSRFEDRITGLIGREVFARQRATLLQNALPQVYMSAAFAVLLGGLGLASLVGVSELSAVGSVMLVMLRSLSYGQQMQTASASLMAGLPALDQIVEVQEMYRDSPAPLGTAPVVSALPIEFCSVGFNYRSDRPALSDVNLRIERGEAIGVIGPSGAGKSTFAQLLLGVQSPTRGAVLANGVDLALLDRAGWTSRVAFVPQEPLTFTGTVAENIRFFRDDVTDADVVAAAVSANFLSDVEEMPNGFDTHLGPRGSQLSGGQRQRLSIARALAGRPDLLVLDEPTSALDVSSESSIREALGRRSGELTVVIIAHRMSTLDICDRIVVIEDGHVSAVGTPDELRSTSAFYRRSLSLSNLD